MHGITIKCLARLKSIIIIFMSVGMPAGIYAEKQPEYTRAEIKVSYRYHEKFLRGNTQYTERDIPMLLLVNSKQSKFYCQGTEYKDSLKSAPSTPSAIRLSCTFLRIILWSRQLSMTKPVLRKWAYMPSRFQNLDGI